jgi:hypothetical protein
VAFQVAVSLVLLVAGGLFVRTMVNLRTQAMGFQPERLLLFQMNATLNGYAGDRLDDFYRQVIERVGALPGVRTVSCSRYGIPDQGSTRQVVKARRDDGTASEGKTYVHMVAPRYFETMGVPLQAGRDVAWTDGRSAPRVALVNQAFARQFFAGASPVGRRIVLENEPTEVIGLVGDVKFYARETPLPTVYVPYAQSRQRAMTFAIKTSAEPAALAGSIRATLAALDPDVPIYALRTQEEQIDSRSGRPGSSPTWSRAWPPSRCSWPAWGSTARSRIRWCAVRPRSECGWRWARIARASSGWSCASRSYRCWRGS